MNESDAPTLSKLILSKITFNWIMFYCFCFSVGFCVGWFLLNYYIEEPIINRMCYKNNTFQIEIAQTREELSRGLGFRNRLDANNGMLFVFEGEGIRSFWMMDMRIPLDIIWLDDSNIVLYIAENVQPCHDPTCKSIAPNVNASTVLELNAGTVNRIGLAVGDQFDFC